MSDARPLEPIVWRLTGTCKTKHDLLSLIDLLFTLQTNNKNIYYKGFIFIKIFENVIPVGNVADIIFRTEQK